MIAKYFVLPRARPQIASMTEVADGKRSINNDQVTYGPFADAKPLDDGGELRVHYVSESA